MQADADEKLETILYQAVEIESAEQRDRFLAEACAGDASLRANVDKMIHNHFAAGSFLEHPAVGITQILGEDAGTSDDSTHTTVSAEDVLLGFLEPSEQPGSLGRLGRYEILEVIGRGGMGIVLKARDTDLQRIVAVKVLAPELAANATARKRFLREAQAAAAVSHNHVVTIHAVEENGGVANGTPAKQGHLPFLVMEFIDGQSLQEKIDRQGPLELKEILRIGRQIASGLAAAQRQGLIHRDIKPANILLQNGVQRVQITDFGLARAVDDVGMTRTGEPTAGGDEDLCSSVVNLTTRDRRRDTAGPGLFAGANCVGPTRRNQFGWYDRRAQRSLLTRFAQNSHATRRAWKAKIKTYRVQHASRQPRLRSAADPPCRGAFWYHRGSHLAGRSAELGHWVNNGDGETR